MSQSSPSPFLSERTICEEADRVATILKSNSADKDKIAALLCFLDDIHSNDAVVLSDEFFETLLEFGSVPTVDEQNQRDLDVSDFVSVDICSAASFKCFGKLFSKGTINSSENGIIPCLLLCAQHMHDDLWTSKDSVATCQSTLEILLERQNATNIVDVLKSVGDLRTNLLKLFNRLVNPRLTRDNWKHNPGHMSAFGWYLSQLKHPHMELVLDKVLPPSLLFVDDFHIANRLSGIKFLSQIMENVPKYELKRNGYADVIYAALKNLVYTREPSIIVAIYPCLLQVLSIIEPNNNKAMAIRKTNHSDALLETALQEMASESVISLRTAYSQILSLLIKSLGIRVVKQQKTIVKVILQYLDIRDPAEEAACKNSLRALRTLINICWPRISHYMENIIKGLLLLLYNIHENNFISNEIKTGIVDDCITCLKQLRVNHEEAFNAACKSFIDAKVDIPVLLYVKAFLEEIT